MVGKRKGHCQPQDMSLIKRIQGLKSQPFPIIYNLLIWVDVYENCLVKINKFGSKNLETLLHENNKFVKEVVDLLQKKNNVMAKISFKFHSYQ